jgi:hypothetical protein
VWNGSAWGNQGSAGGASPGGSNTAIQFNDSGVFGGAFNGANGLQWDKSTGSLGFDGGGAGIAQFAVNGATEQLTIAPGSITWNTAVTNFNSLNAEISSLGILSLGGPVHAPFLGGTGLITLNGITSGSANISVADAAGTPNQINLPTATGAASGVLQTDGGSPQQTSWTTSPTLSTIKTAGNCASSASPAVCGSSASGSVAVPAGTNPTLTVNTTAVTANSVIFLFEDESLGTKLSVTCQTAVLPSAQFITARVAATSFTFQANGTFAANPVCYNYLVVN